LAAAISGRRQRRKSETLNRILAAAVQLFAERGYAETTVEDITEAADVGKGTFFNYFPTKDAVLLAVFENLRAEFAHYEDLIPKTRDVRSFLRKIVYDILNNPTRSQKLVRSILGKALMDPAVSQPFEAAMHQARHAVTSLLQRGQDLGQVRKDIPAAVLGRTFQQFIFGTQMLWAFSSNEDLYEWADVMLDIFWRGAAHRGKEQLVEEKQS
jgi:AcrR family transcriptional regulator